MSVFTQYAIYLFIYILGANQKEYTWQMVCKGMRDQCIVERVYILPKLQIITQWKYCKKIKICVRDFLGDESHEIRHVWTLHVKYLNILVWGQNPSGSPWG